MKGETRFFACVRERGGGFAGLTEVAASVSTAAEPEVRCR